MADTATTVLGLVKPEVGASTDTWGPKYHSALDAIDALFTDPAKKMLKLANGGTGADTAAGARTNLGLGTLATLNVVGTAQITDASITTAKIADSNITTSKIADSNVTTAKIADSNVTTAKIADSNVTTAKIADNNVTTAKIADAAVTTVKLLDGNITLEKLAAAVAVLLTPVGAVSAYVGLTAPTGWLLLSGATIGNGSSGATARANADAESLYVLIWNAFDNTRLPIQDSSGLATTRGGSAAADFAANKRLPLPDLRGRVIAGQDDMGGTSANRLTGLSGGIDGDIMGNTGGSQSHVLTIAELANHNHTVFAADDGGSAESGGGDKEPQMITIQSSFTGGDQPHNNVQPTIILNYMVKY